MQIKAHVISVMQEQKKCHLGYWYIADPKSVRVAHKIDVFNGHLFVQFEYYDPYNHVINQSKWVANKKEYFHENMYIDLENIIQNDMDYFEGYNDGVSLLINMTYEKTTKQIIFRMKAINKFPSENNPKFPDNSTLFEGTLYLRCDN